MQNEAVISFQISLSTEMQNFTFRQTATEHFLIFIVFMFVDPCIIAQFIKKKKIQQDATVYQSFISYLCEAQHVSGDTPPIIRSLKLYWQPLVFFIRGRLLDV